MALSPASWGTGGGSAPPTGRAIYSGADVVIADGDQSPLTLDFLDDGTALLDISSPATPKVIASGIYAVTVAVANDIATAGGWYSATLVMDQSGIGAEALATGFFELGAGFAPRLIVSQTFYLVAGEATIRVSAANEDGGGLPNTFSVRALNIQRVT